MLKVLAILGCLWGASVVAEPLALPGEVVLGGGLQQPVAVPKLGMSAHVVDLELRKGRWLLAELEAVGDDGQHVAPHLYVMRPGSQTDPQPHGSHMLWQVPRDGAWQLVAWSGQALDSRMRLRVRSPFLTPQMRWADEVGWRLPQSERTPMDNWPYNTITLSLLEGEPLVVEVLKAEGMLGTQGFLSLVGPKGQLQRQSVGRPGSGVRYRPFVAGEAGVYQLHIGIADGERRPCAFELLIHRVPAEHGHG